MSLTARKVDAIARVLLSEIPEDYEQAMDDLRRLMESPDDAEDLDITVRIHDLLAKVGIPCSARGHTYLVDAIIATLEDPLVLEGITSSGGLYDQIGERYGKSNAAVQHAMRDSIQFAWDHGDQEFQNRYFPVVSSVTLVPTILNFISRAANILKFRQGL